MSASQSPLTAVIVGAGNRGYQYACHSLDHPDDLKIVGVVEPDDFRRERARRTFDLPEDRCFRRFDELMAQPKMADAIINGTMDRDHVATSVPALEAGYDMLLEKPICGTRAELCRLIEVVRRTQRRVLICHVLRYAPFYAEIRRRVADGAVGDILTIHTAEYVSYHHMSAAFVRGRWRRRDTASPILLAKCCHDLDIICWMKSGVAPRRVSSFGSRTFYIESNAPEGAGTRCVDCAIEPECSFSARKHYLEQGLWGFYAWEPIQHIEHPTEEDKIASLKGDNPWGKCVFRSDNDVVDHQSVVTEFADGAISTHGLVGTASSGRRVIHIVGTRGEIEGVMEHGKFVVRTIAPKAGQEYVEETVDVSLAGSGHGGGDSLLVEDFVRVLRGQPASLSTTELMDSVNSHLMAYAADEAMREGRVVPIEPV